jgi:FAS-associated factor 2
VPFEPARGYAEVTRRAKDEDRYLLVVLVSEVHDDTAPFCRDVLCDGTFRGWVRENDVVCWAGNVADSEAHTGISLRTLQPQPNATPLHDRELRLVANSLNCTRYPFVALIANVPGPQHPAQMTLLTKIEGLTPTNRLLAALSAGVSRTKATLMQRRAVKAEQNFARDLRRQQEEAYTNSLNADRAREEAEWRRREEEERVERVAREREEEVRLLGEKRVQWRLWKAGDLRSRGLVGMKSEIGKTARVGLRLSSGERIVQMFPGDITLAEVYSFVDCYDLLFPKTVSSASGTTLRAARSMESVGSEEERDLDVDKPDGYEHEFAFRLVVPYPRKVIDSGFTLVKQESGLWPSGSVVVEAVEEESESESEEED